MVIELVGTLASIGSFLLDAGSFRLAVKDDFNKIDSILFSAQEELMESKKIMNQYYCLLEEKEREEFYEEYDEYVRLEFMHDHDLQLIFL